MRFSCRLIDFVVFRLIWFVIQIDKSALDNEENMESVNCTGQQVIDNLNAHADKVSRLAIIFVSVVGRRKLNSSTDHSIHLEKSISQHNLWYILSYYFVYDLFIICNFAIWNNKIPTRLMTFKIAKRSLKHWFSF